MPIPLHPPQTPAHRITAGLATVLLAGAALAATGCAKPEPSTLTPAALDRDRAAREIAVAEIERDHETLASLIASDRFSEPEAIYSDPELRRVALRLVEQSNALRRLADSDILSPGAP